MPLLRALGHFAALKAVLLESERLFAFLDDTHGDTSPDRVQPMYRSGIRQARHSVAEVFFDPDKWWKEAGMECVRRASAGFRLAGEALTRGSV